MTTAVQMETTIEALVPLAKLVWRERDALDPATRLILSEVAGLFDALTGVCATNPKERAFAHINTLDRLVNELPTVGVRTTDGESAAIHLDSAG